MKTKPQVIFDNGKPAFVVLRYEDYIRLAGEDAQPNDNEFVPFVLGDYIKNPIRVARIEAGLSQQELASLLAVTQGYVSRIEGRNFKVTNELLNRVKSTISKERPRKNTRKRS
jgi:ribosome-binding protein aMBF1 (putative translation factor)